MPIKRKATKARAHRVTAEAASAFIEAQRGRERYIGCIRGEGCRSTSASEHCGECRAHLDAHRRLHRALGLRLWQMSPLDAEATEPPSHPGYVESWPLACELRAELEKAAGEIEA